MRHNLNRFINQRGLGVAFPIFFLWMLFLLSLELARGCTLTSDKQCGLITKLQLTLIFLLNEGLNWWLRGPLVMSPVMNEATLLRQLRGGYRKVRGPDFHQPAMRSRKPSMENGGGLEKVGTSSVENLIGAWPCVGIFNFTRYTFGCSTLLVL